MNQSKCDDCGVMVAIGDSPFCSHGHGRMSDGALFAHTFTPYLDEHIVADGHPEKTARVRYDDGVSMPAVEITSQAHRRRLMKEGGWELRSPKRGMPGCEV